MPKLKKEDLICLNCNLKECNDKTVNCKRTQFRKEEKEYKQNLKVQKMSSVLVPVIPIAYH